MKGSQYPIMIFQDFNEELSQSVLMDLLYYDHLKEMNFYSSEDSEFEAPTIRMYINSHGGYVNDLTAIIDTMNNLGFPIETYCLGMAASCAAVLLSNGTKGKRFIGKNARVLLHQVSGFAYGQINDMDDSVKEAKKVNEQILAILSKNTGKSIDVLREDMKRDFWLSAKEAKKYGLVDKILEENSMEEKAMKEVELKMNKINLEYKSLEKGEITRSFEIKSMDETDKFFTFKAYASIFNSSDDDNDVVCKGAFKKTLLYSNILENPNERTLVWQHDPKNPIGKAILLEDDTGLYVEAIMPFDDDFVRGKVIPQIKTGSIKNLSFGFRAKNSYRKNGKRYLTEIDLVEVALVTIPAHKDSKIISYKGNAFNAFGDISKFLKARGLTKRETDDVVISLKEILSNCNNFENRNACNEHVENLACNELNEGAKKIFKEMINNLTQTIQFMKRSK